MPLSGGFHQPFPPWTEDVAAIELELPTQFIDCLLVFLDGLIVELGGLIEAAWRRSSTCWLSRFSRS